MTKCENRNQGLSSSFLEGEPINNFIIFYIPFYDLSTGLCSAVESLGGRLEHHHQSCASGDMAGVSREYPTVVTTGGTRHFIYLIC